MSTRYQLIGNFREKLVKHWLAAKLALFEVQIVVYYPKMSNPVYEDNLKSLLMMATPKNLQILLHEQGSQFHYEILETATEDAVASKGEQGREVSRGQNPLHG